MTVNCPVHIRVTERGARRLRQRLIMGPVAALGLLDWSQSEVASRARLIILTMQAFQRGREKKRSTNLAIREALEAGGVQFIEENGGGAGLRLWTRS